MAQLVVSVAGAAIGFAIGGPAGAKIGWVAGSMIGSTFAPTQKSQGPRLEDLTVSTSSYGTPIPYIAGHPRIAGQIVWASTKREIATTESAGKGGGGGSEYTTFTYEVDLLILLSDNQIAGIRRVWSNGEIVFTSDADADSASLMASYDTDLWSRMTVYTGASTQLPDPDYESVVGTANAPAYRGRGSVFIKSLQLGGGGQIPNLTFEVFVDGDFVTAKAVLVFNASSGVGDALVDESSYARPMDEWNTSQPSWITKAAGYSAETQSMYFSNSSDHSRYIEVDDAPSPENYDFGTDPFCAEAWCKQEASHALSTVLATINHTSSGRFGIYLGTNQTGKFWMCVGNPAAGGVGLYPVISTITPILGAWYHLAGTRVGGVLKLWVNGELAATAAIDPAYNVADSVGVAYKWSIGSNQTYTYYNWRGWIGGVRVMRGYPIYTEPFTPPTGLMTDIQISAATINDTYIAPTVSALCLQSGMQASQFDVSLLSSITRPVRAMSISQVSSARTVLEILGAAYHFDAVLSDKLYFRPRGTASVATLTFDEFGVAVDSGASDPLPLMMANELEIPAQMAITFMNTDGDYQTDTQYSDRLLTGQESTSATSLPLGFTASEGKQIADATLLDKAVSALSTMVGVGITRAKLEPTDVVILTGDDGSTYRMRVVKKSESLGVITLGCVADDASVFTQSGTTDGGTTGQTTVFPTPTTTLYLLDIPLLRDADNVPGHYVSVKGSAANWTSCALFESADDVTYTQNATISGSAVMGECTTTLGTWTGGNFADEANTLTVDVGAGQLSSVTHEQMLSNAATNAALVGDEIIQFRDATLVSAGVYTLRGLLRGKRGTEGTTHAAAERFVLLGTSGLRFIPQQTSDIGQLIYYRAPAAGQKLSAVTSQSMTLLANVLKPFSPVNIRNAQAGDDSFVITWDRRTRLSENWMAGVLPLGETVEAYEVDILNGATVVRTASTSTPTFTYSYSMQIEDFGVAQLNLNVHVRQMSDAGVSGNIAATLPTRPGNYQTYYYTLTGTAQADIAIKLWVGSASPLISYTTTGADTTLNIIATAVASLVDATSYEASADGSVITIISPSNRSPLMTAERTTLGSATMGFGVVTSAGPIRDATRSRFALYVANWQTGATDAVPAGASFYITFFPSESYSNGVTVIYTTPSDMTGASAYSALAYLANTNSQVTNMGWSLQGTSEYAANGEALGPIGVNAAIQSGGILPWQINRTQIDTGMPASAVATAQSTQFDVWDGTIVSGDTFSIILNDVYYTATAGGASTIETIADDLVAQIDAASAYISVRITVTGARASLLVTSTTTNLPFSYSVKVAYGIEVTKTTGPAIVIF